MKALSVSRISVPLILQRQESADQVVLRPDEFDVIVAVLQQVDKNFEEWRRICAEVAPHAPLERSLSHAPLERSLSPASVQLLDLIECFDRRALHLVPAR